MVNFTLIVLATQKQAFIILGGNTAAAVEWFTGSRELVRDERETIYPAFRQSAADHFWVLQSSQVFGRGGGVITSCTLKPAEMSLSFSQSESVLGWK